MAPIYFTRKNEISDNELGFILPVTLVFILIFSAIGLSLLGLLQQENRVLYDRIVSINTPINRHILLNRVAASLEDDSLACMLTPISSIELKKKSNHWWLANGCHMVDGKINIYYVAELLESDNCVISDDSIPLTIKYYRITFLIMSEYKSIIQSAITHSEPRRESCNADPHRIAQGVRYWLIV